MLKFDSEKNVNWELKRMKDQLDTFWSNCLIEALKRKLKDWNKIVLIPLFTGFHFHIMWYDRKSKKISHFTHRRLSGWFCTLFFKGTIDNVEYDSLKQYCESHNIKLKI